MTPIIGLVLRVLMMLSLAIFTFLAFQLIWKSLHTNVSQAGNLVIPLLTLSYDRSGHPLEQSFTSNEVTIGRDQECDLSVPNSTMSARHAMLSFHQNQWWIEDLNSTNGSYIEDLRIEEPMVIKDGDVITCGEVPIMISIKPS
ncbi:MAG: FHA domain-containing protein [Anaerolineaceae bacterium]|nr:FHA domain-containing protein [Anaerolineaceae bacterium]